MWELTWQATVHGVARTERLTHSDVDSIELCESEEVQGVASGLVGAAYLQLCQGLDDRE